MLDFGRPDFTYTTISNNRACYDPQQTSYWCQDTNFCPTWFYLYNQRMETGRHPQIISMCAYRPKNHYLAFLVKKKTSFYIHNLKIKNSPPARTYGNGTSANSLLAPTDPGAHQRLQKQPLQFSKLGWRPWESPMATHSQRLVSTNEHCRGIIKYINRNIRT